MTLQFHEEIARAKCEFFKRREIVIKNLPPVTYQEIKDFLKGYCVVDIAISKKSRQAIVTLKNGGEAEEIVRRFDQTMLFSTVVGVSLYPNTRLLCVSNIPTHVSHQQFVNFVSTFGKVNKCFLMGFVHPAPNSSKHKGYGFVEFLHNVQKIEECRQTINGYLVWNSVLHCCQATSQLLTFNDLHSMVLRIDNLPQSSQQVDSVVKSLINLSRLQIVKLVGGEKCILAEFKTFIDTEAAYHALRHVTVGPHRLHTQFCLPGFSLDELEADLKELDRLKKTPSISDTTATLQSIIDQNGAVNGNSLVHQNIMLLMSAFHKDHAVAAVPSAPIPAPLPTGVSANPCLPSHIATITGMGVNNARAQTLPATGQVHINHASLQAADRVPASSVTSRGHHCSSVNSTLNTTKPTPLTAPTPLTVSTPSNILLPVPQVLQKVASTESRDSQSHDYCSETTNKLYSLSDPTCFQLPDDYHGDEHYVNHVIKQTPIQKNLQVLSASQQLQHNPIDNPLPLATALIPSGLLVPPVTLSDDLMSKHRRVDLKSTPLMPTVDGVQPLSEAILNIVGQGTSLVPNQVQSQRPGVVSGAEHGHVLGSHDMNSTVKDNELFNQAKLLRGLNGLGDGSNVENENHSLLKTPFGMSRKRSHPSLLPPPEPSPEGDYIGQHSQGIGGHYAESYRKRKRIL